MKYFLAFVGLLIILIGIVYVVPSLHAQATKLLSYSACNTPMPYKIGSTDKRFGLTNEQVLSDTKQATQIWSTEEGKKLFTYSPNAKLTVNFVYDQRQELDSSINELNSQLKENSSTLDKQIAQYKADVAAFEQKLAAFNAEVDTYNSQGGAPKDVYDRLKQQQQDLDAQGKALNERAQELHLATQDYNSGVATLNNDIAAFNSTLKKTPEEGLYNGEDDTITIYITHSQQDLIHTLTHEFGHALGMQHVDDERAIMYPYTTPYLAITPEDREQLTYVCREQSLIIHELQQVDIWIGDAVSSIYASVKK